MMVLAGVLVFGTPAGVLAEEADHSMEGQISKPQSSGESDTEGFVDDSTDNTYGYYTIMGCTTVDAEDMVVQYEAQNVEYPSGILTEGGAPDIDTFCTIVIEEADAEGVRGEVVFEQARRQDDIEHNRDQKDHNDSLQTLEHEFHRNLGYCDHSYQKCCCHRISEKCMKQEHRDQKSQSSQKFGPWVQSVKNGFGRIILANGNISDHFSAPPLFSNGEFACASAARILSLASSTVVASASTYSPCSFSACMI